LHSTKKRVLRASAPCYYRSVVKLLLWARRHCGARYAASLLLFCALAGGVGHAQSHGVVCREGNGNFEAESYTGVAVQVGAERRDGLATRKCEGALLWGTQKLVVASTAAQVDVDAFGIDLGLGAPVVTFQAKKPEAQCCMTLQIYSLQRPPKLLRAITGGSFFSTADTDLDGQIEIWTDDAAAIEGFESPNVGRPEFAPTVVLRFVRGRLLDVGSEFRSHFDSEIASVRSELDPEDLRDFKNSNGRLAPTAHFSQEDQSRSERLERIKAKVLRIIWAYLYSGREEEAWKFLAEMWPAADVDRIRGSISGMRARGILAQTDGASTSLAPHAGLAKIFDLRTQAAPISEMGWGRSIRTEKGSQVIPPAPILIERRAPVSASEADVALPELLVELVIDSAGKVRSAESAAPAFDASLKSEVGRWKFVPAFDGGHGVASHVYMLVSQKR
jgi:hypothetical protein